MKDSGLLNIASNLSSIIDVLVLFVWGICIIVAIVLFVGGILQFNMHRNNPKMVPLTVPAMYFILSLCVAALPFIEKLTGVMTGGRLERSEKLEKNIQKKKGSVSDKLSPKKNTNKKNKKTIDIDEPLN